MAPRLRRVRPALLAAGVLVSAVLVALPAAGAVSAAERLSATTASTVLPAVAVDDAGNAVTVWYDLGDGTGTTESVLAATRPAGGTWSAPVVLAAGRDLEDAPSVVADADGNLLALWRESAPGSASVVYRTLPEGTTTWTARSVVTTTGYRPAVSAAPDGRLVAAWIDTQTARTALATGSVASGLSTPQLLTTPGGAGTTAVDVAVAPSGGATLVWSDSAAGTPGVWSVRRTHSGAWSGVVPVGTSPEPVANLDVVAGADGAAAAIWSRRSSGTADRGTYAARADADGVWSGPVRLGPSPNTGTAATPPRLAVDPAGRLSALWTQRTPTGQRLMLSSAPAGGPWDAPVDLWATRDNGSGTVVADPQGRVTVLANRVSGATTLGTATGAAGTSPGAPTTLWSGYTDSTSVAVAGDGDLVVAWSGFETGNRYVVRAAVVDDHGPAVDALSVPGEVAVGTPVDLAVEGTDVSGIASVAWDLGDGSAATGSRVRHAFTTPGDVRVEVTLTDGAGNASTHARTVRVVPAPPPVPDQPEQPEPPAGPPVGPPTDPPSIGTTITLVPSIVAPGPSSDGLELALRHRRITLLGGRSTTVAQVTLPRATRTRISLLHHRATRRGREGRLMNRVTVVGTLEAGTHDIAIRTSMGKYGLRPGTYTLTAKAVGLPGRPSVSRTLTVRR